MVRRWDKYGFLVVLCCSTSVVLASTIHVPADQPTIQAGIDTASDGDTVLVAPGTYLENIDFKGRAITVTSSDGADLTVIDGSLGDVAVSFITRETRSSVINGFTIRNAGSSKWPNEDPRTYFYGINVIYANPTITNNRIMNNYGYAVSVFFGGALVEGNVISGTRTQYDPRFDYGCDYDDGSGIALQGASSDPSYSIVISNNVIEHNIGRCGGGGMFLYAAGVPTITNNIIRYNESKGQGGGIWMVNGNALVLVQNLIYGNTAGSAGGGVFLGNGSSGLYVVNNTIVGNAIFNNPEVIGDYVDGSQIAFGGAVSGTAFFNNIVIGGDTYGTVACNPDYQYLSPTPLEIDNSDMYSFSGPWLSGWCVVPPTITNNTISTDALFSLSKSEPFRLQPTSPAIGTGDTSAPYLPSQDLAGNPRIQSGAIDMGVYEGGYLQRASQEPDFSISAVPTSLTIKAGGAGTSTITITPSGGYIGAVSFHCSQLPVNLYCVFDPLGVAAGGDNLVLQTVVTIGAISTNSQPPIRRSMQNADAGLWYVGGGLFVFALCVRVREHRPVRRSIAQAAVLNLLLVVATSCGGGGDQNSPPPPPPPPPNKYTVVVTGSATGNTARPSRTLNLTVTIE